MGVSDGRGAGDGVASERDSTPRGHKQLTGGARNADPPGVPTLRPSRTLQTRRMYTTNHISPVRRAVQVGGNEIILDVLPTAVPSDVSLNLPPLLLV